MSTITQGIDRIPDSLGFLVLNEDGAVLSVLQAKSEIKMEVEIDCVPIKIGPVKEHLGQTEQNNREIGSPKSDQRSCVIKREPCQAEQFWDAANVSVSENGVWRDMSNPDLRIWNMQTDACDLNLARVKTETSGIDPMHFKIAPIDSTFHQGQSETNDNVDYREFQKVKREVTEVSDVQSRSTLYKISSDTDVYSSDRLKFKNESMFSDQALVCNMSAATLLNPVPAGLIHVKQEEYGHESLLGGQESDRCLSVTGSRGQLKIEVDDSPNPVPGTMQEPDEHMDDSLYHLGVVKAEHVSSSKFASELPVICETTGLNRVSKSDEDVHQSGCSTKTSVKSSLTEHKEVSKSPKPGGESYKCKECKDVFSCELDLLIHKRDHLLDRRLKCDQCCETFEFDSFFVRHRRIHTGETPFKCDQCDKAFKQKSTLIIHQRIHTKEKPFKCYKCDKAFEERSHLTSHRHIHTGKIPFKCDQCDEAFEQRCDLMTHQNIHTNAREKPYKCSQCDKTFMHRSGRKQHKLTHEEERPFECDLCDKTFTQRGHLKTHKRTHTGKKPFRCDICDLAFAYSHQLVRHKDHIHIEEGLLDISMMK
ncbi:zinc finger protein 267-like [Lineus longissimus]|uniref:zinc finger protein 267-like n=1 Tax=Lineus longissimus TaxID=88925 RepID=UPI002B4DFBBE